jgi:hypothetical protein
MVPFILSKTAKVAMPRLLQSMKKIGGAARKMLLCYIRPDVKQILRNLRKYMRFLRACGIQDGHHGFPKTGGVP